MKKDEYLALISKSDALFKARYAILEKVESINTSAKDAMKMIDFVNIMRRPKTTFSTAPWFHITTSYFSEGVGIIKAEHRIEGEALLKVIVDSIESATKQFIIDNDLTEIIEVLLNPELGKGK